jgi:hypothetical protein
MAVVGVDPPVDRPVDAGVEDAVRHMEDEDTHPPPEQDQARQHGGQVSKWLGHTPAFLADPSHTPRLPPVSTRSPHHRRVPGGFSAGTSEARWENPAYQAFCLLRVGFTAAPILFGLDKYAHVLVNWDRYLAPWIDKILPGTAHS